MALLPWAINAVASRCAPVPQSKIRRSPLAVVSSTQEVLPPKWLVPGPGVAIDPLVPQKRTRMGLRLILLELADVLVLNRIRRKSRSGKLHHTDYRWPIRNRTTT